jgi:ankyrin repeat protein
MDLSRILELISKGRTDLVIELLALPDARDAITAGQVKPLQWCAYYNDVTAMRLVLDRFGEFPDYDVNEELLNGAYYGHWKVCDFLITQGANVNTRLLNTGETPLHNAIAKADRPHFVFVVQLLLEHGADVNAKTVAGMETGAFMRDVRTRGYTAPRPMRTNVLFHCCWNTARTGKPGTSMGIRHSPGRVITFARRQFSKC